MARLSYIGRYHPLRHVLLGIGNEVTIRDGYVDASGVRFHYLEGGEPGNGTPVVYVPGFLADAEWFREEMGRLAPRHTISISMRGRGKSEAPATGYSFEDHVADLEAILSQMKLQPFCLIAFSRGVSYTLGYALRNLERVKGLIFQDSDPVYPAPTKEWVRTTTAKMPNVSPHVIEAISKESSDVSLWDSLEQIKCPVLIMRGTDSMLSEEDAERYKSVLPQAREVVFKDAGHIIWMHDYDGFYREIEQFVTSLD